MSSDRKVVLVTRRTRLEELVVRHNSVGQAKFYIEHLGADFADYVLEHDTYRRALDSCLQRVEPMVRIQQLDRSFLPNFIFAPDDIIVTLGQDGLVANTLKYLDTQPVVAINPDPTRWDGVLLPFQVQDTAAIVAEALANKRQCKRITMAEVTLNDGQRLRAVNDLFIGQRTHVSARYAIQHGQLKERQSSSGVIVSTGLGSTGWLRSVLTTARRLEHPDDVPHYEPLPWDKKQLRFVVREAFPSRATGTELIMGQVDKAMPLRIASEMPEGGVIFADGMEVDALQFGAGFTAHIQPAAHQAVLVV
ncbi:sugar kinase [Permianibacter sp. IMCC34836]|uniref:sugar kinase n=1 Tax=Permianibacter fluminis TaxID=2738515 RepID=UPI0015524AFE|nr:sugar kinase [Permianibacter fluminis]NQD35983.1 sugar kinase [Permianibacter fluminis]